jgi:hypothetical protein
LCSRRKQGLSGCQSLGGRLRVAQLEAEIAQLEKALRQRQQTGVATGLLAQRFKISRQPARTLAVDDADDENGGVANPKLTIVKDQP